MSNVKYGTTYLQCLQQQKQHWVADGVAVIAAGKSNQDADSRLDTCLPTHDSGIPDKCNLQVKWTLNTL